MNVNRAAIIEGILIRRARDVELIRDLDGSVSRLEAALDFLAETQRALEPRLQRDALQILRNIAMSVGDVRRHAATVRNDLGRMMVRFARPTLTIGAVGRGGQGKSRFLQSLTGLTDKEIPSARGGFMTGAPSHIRAGTGPTVAEVEFYDDRTFLAEIIAPYYRKLGLGPEPKSLDEFGRSTPPSLPPDSSMRNAHAYDHLLAYRGQLERYRHYLTDSRRVRPIAPEDIIRYVAQHDGEGNKTHDFRAVRRVRITAQFPQGDLGNLAVIDLPGLGDTNLHDEQVLRTALDGEVDLVLFIRRPDPLREGVHDVDVDLYDVTRTALPELPVDRWSFMVLNRVQGGDGDNTAMLDEFAAAVRRSRVQVTDIAAANCGVREQVAEVFDSVVTQAVGALDELDLDLINRRRLEVALLFDEADALADEAQSLMRRAVPSGEWFHQFLGMFNQIRGRLAHGLTELVKELHAGTTEYDDGLSTAVRDAIAKARANVVVPPTTEIEVRASTAGAYTNVLNDMLNEQRAQIARQFLELDTALKVRVDNMHDQVADVLRYPGGLECLGLGSGVEFLRAFGERLPNDGSVHELRIAFRFLADFTLNYRGLIQHRVRRRLDKLTPDSMPYDQDSGALGIEYIVRELVEETLYDVETELQEVFLEPREALFAVVEEFADRVLRSHGVEDEWRTVYETLRSDVWADEFAALAENTELFNQWTDAINRVVSAADDLPRTPANRTGR